MGNELTAKTVFVTIALLNIMKSSLASSLPQGFAAVCESYASLERIQVYRLIQKYFMMLDSTIVCSSMLSNFFRLKK